MVVVLCGERENSNIGVGKGGGGGGGGGHEPEWNGGDMLLYGMSLTLSSY